MENDIVLGGRPLRVVGDHVRRYCGLTWSGGDPEVWAYPFYDTLRDDDPDRVSETDLISVAAVHPSITRADLVWFVEVREQLDQILTTIDPTVGLGDADAHLIEAVARLACCSSGRLALATRVLHRKRPRAVPLFGKHLVERYHHRLERRGEACWPALLENLAGDVGSEQNRNSLAELRDELSSELDPVPSDLRLIDIAIWMEAR
ncbi:MAG: DUF6308 family protein [Acidimicrobiales bacterium]|nr:DUF6308 family protein [Acidimicrobiales bacterium]